MAVDVERVDTVAIVTMNRPSALNAFDTEQLTRLLAVFRELAEDQALRCVVFTGTGDKAFAAGADIKEMVAMSRNEALRFGQLGHAVGTAIESFPRPVIAAVNGYAFGGGCEMALACDIRLASENAQFAQPEVSLGIPPGWGGTQRLPRLVGLGVASELIFTGRRVKADEALRIGLVNAVYPADRLLPEATVMARAIASVSPNAVRISKQLIALSFAADIANSLATEATRFGECFGTVDQQEGMSAFVEKRQPQFRGD